MLIQAKTKNLQPGRTLVLMFSVLIALTCSYASADTDQYLDDNSLLSALRQGGLNIYFRHEATNWSQGDNVQKADDWLSCDGNEIRQLSDAGRNHAKSTGQAIKSLGIPIGKVIASPYCRTVETARLMRLGPVEASNDVINLRVAEYFGGRAAIVRTAQALLASAPAAGTNNLIVAHGNVAQAATPVYPSEGEGVVFKPDDKGGFQVVGRLTPADWVRLANSLN